MFDVQGARKAGYTDAEIAAFLADRDGFDLKGAKSAGYSDGEVIAHLSARPVAGAIPGQEGEAARVEAARARPAPTLTERAIGTGEAALTTVTGATGGTLGMIGGTLKSLAEQILSGQFGTQDAARAVEQAAAAGAQALTYAPRTEQGQEQAQAVGEALQQVIPVAAVLPGLAPAAAARPAGTPGVVARAGVEGVARDVAGQPGAAAAARTIDAATRVADLAKTQATTLPRRALDRLRKPAEDTPTPGTMGSVGAAGTDMAAQRQALAQGLPVPMRLTKGQASRDPAQLKFETEAAKMPEQGGALRERMVEQNAQILANFDTWIDQTGAQAPSLRAVGQVVDSALVKQARADKGAIRAAFNAADRAGELEAPITLTTLVQHLNDAAPEATTAPLLNTARNVAIKLGVAVDDGGTLIPQPVPLKTAERFRQAVNRNVDTEPTNIRQATIMKGLVDEATDGLGGNLYRQARALRRRYAQNYEDRAAVANLLAKKRGTEDRRIALEDVFDATIMRGSLDDVRNVRRVLQRSGEDGQQAWRELQGATVRSIKDRAFGNNATDSAGRPVVSSDKLTKAVRELDADGRLEFIFGKQGAQQMRDIADLAQVVRTVPPEAFVNTSNTAATFIAAMLDTGFTAMSGTPAPVLTAWRLIRQNVKDRALRQRIDDALGQTPKKAPNNKPGIPQRAPSGDPLH